MLGPSGCGKTTTLRMIGGFEDPTAGRRVPRRGQAVTDLPPYKRDVNTVFQSYALFPHLNVERNVAFGLERKKVGKAEVSGASARASTWCSSAPGQAPPGQLSGGQQQRVALARALVNRPRALLLDEPLGALDLRLRRQLQIELKRIQQEVGITFVHVTHDQEEALSMADTIAVMNEGRIEQVGSARGALRASAHRVRRELPRHLEPGRRQGRARGGEMATVETEDGTRARPVRAHRPTAQRRRGPVGVRPEKIELVPAPSGAPAGPKRCAAR